jgi:hypothetical protein
MEFAHALRSRYPTAHACTCVVDGRVRPPETVSIRCVNFGQHWRTAGIEDVEYRVEVPQRLLLDLLREQLHEYVEDCQKHPDPEFDMDQLLREADWPTAEQVMATPHLADFFARWFAHDLLLHWLGDGPPEQEPGFVLNTVESIAFAEGSVLTIQGKARRSGIPVRYQDV